MLLPPDLREWVPAADPARLVVELVEQLDSSSAAVNHAGTGSEQFPPPMMLALLLYSYSHGVFSSREIERSTYVDIGVRFVCGDTHPDHDTICRFRRANRDYIAGAFRESLALAQQAGLVAMGNIRVATDGTKIAGAASESKTMSDGEIAAELAAIEEQETGLQATIERLLEEAEATDRAVADKPAAVPAHLADPAERVAQLRLAREQLRKKERRKARLEAAREALRANRARRAAERDEMRAEIGESSYGHVPKKLRSEVDPGDKVNVSDPDSQKLKAGNSAGFVQGYNAQASVDTCHDGAGLILGAHVTDHCSDRQQLQANAAELERTLGPGKVASMCADAGYDNTYQVEKIEKRGGPEVICIQQETRNGSGGSKGGGDEGGGEEGGGDPPGAAGGPAKGPKLSKRQKETREKRARHRDRLRQAASREQCKRRRETVEPTYGVIKEQMGFRRFRLRGRRGADLEWRLVAFAFNVRKLARNKAWKSYLVVG